jgi:hypothetical protein
MSRQNVMEVDIWVRGTAAATTRPLANVSAESASWTESDVRALLTEMLLALQQAKDPGGETPPVSLRGFSWIVSPEANGVLVHLEVQIGTASAGPFAIDERRLTDMIGRVISGGAASSVVH